MKFLSELPCIAGTDRGNLQMSSSDVGAFFSTFEQTFTETPEKRNMLPGLTNLS